MKQTISEKISADIRSYMAASVDYGTSRTSKVQGYSSGGKTGTAEKLPRGNGKYLVSFIGFAPVDDPALVIYVVVDEPKVDDQASSTYAQYIAQGILSEALPYLNVQPDEAEDGEVPTTELWELFKGISDSATGTGADGQKEAISDENVPSPPEDESEDSDTEHLISSAAVIFHGLSDRMIPGCQLFYLLFQFLDLTTTPKKIAVVLKSSTGHGTAWT